MADNPLRRLPPNVVRMTPTLSLLWIARCPITVTIVALGSSDCYYCNLGMDNVLPALCGHMARAPQEAAYALMAIHRRRQRRVVPVALARHAARAVLDTGADTAWCSASLEAVASRALGSSKSENARGQRRRSLRLLVKGMRVVDTEISIKRIKRR